MGTAKAALIVATIVLAAGAANAKDCTPTSQQTAWGGNERIVIVQRKALRRLYGQVVTTLDSNQGWGDVLVEVYDHPEVNLLPYDSRKETQKRIAGCKTDETGRFAFELPPGHYELRLSYGSGMNVTSILAYVSRSPFASRKALTPTLHPGT